jgi:cell division protein ZapA (FtsZ GTPase activity inhibitor)
MPDVNPDSSTARSVTVKILGQEYRIRSDEDAAHLERVAAYVDRVLREVQAMTPDTQSAAILVSLNIASELLRMRHFGVVPPDRVRDLIRLVESADEAAERDAGG